MTRRRWIADEVSGNRAALTGSHAEHRARVLRARIAQEFDIATGSNMRRGRITSIDTDRVEFELGEHIPAVAVPKITLALSIFKFFFSSRRRHTRFDCDWSSDVCSSD